MISLSRFWLLIVLTGTAAGQSFPAASLTVEQALQILNDSPWCRQQTFTEVLEGAGSGRFGEKELFSRYYVRILSARPVQEAYLAIQESVGGRSGGEDSSAISPEFFEHSIFRESLVISVTFRSSDPDREREVINIFRSQATETLRNRAYLSTEGFPQVQLDGYAPPEDSAIGAVFFFPRIVDGQPILKMEDGEFVFDLELPDEDETKLRVTFAMTPEVLTLPTGRSADSPPVQEFQVGTGVAGANGIEAGRMAALVNRFPQQAGSAIHGSVYWFHRNDNLDARNFFDDVGEPLPEFKRNQFGGSLGAQLGPRLNLFFSYDLLRIVQGSTLLSLVPSEAMKRGDFSELLGLEDPIQLVDPLSGAAFLNNQIPGDRIHPVVRGLLPLIPNPNRDDSVRNFVNNQAQVEDVDTFTLRADYRFDEESSLTVSYQRPYSTEADAEPLPAFGKLEVGRRHEVNFGYRRTFGENLTAEFRLEFERDREATTTREPRPPGLVESLGIEGIQISGPEDEGYPVFELEDYQGFGDEDVPENEVSNEGTFAVSMSWARGDHLLQFSGETGFNQANDVRSSGPERGEFSFTGRFTGDAFADFLLGRAEEATRAQGSSRQDLRSRNYQLGVTDRWRLSPRITLSLGVNYGYTEPFRTLHPNISVFRPLLVNPGTGGGLVIPEDSAGSSVVLPDRNNFAPRLGLAFRPLETSRLVVRASYGIFYNGLPSFLFENYMGRNYPFYYSQSSQASSDSSGLDLSNPFNDVIALELGIRDIEPEFSTPYSQNWDLRIETELTDSWTLELAYLGRRGVHQRRTLSGNIPAPGPGPIQPRRPNPDFGEFFIVTGSGFSNRHSLEVNLEHRFTSGFSLDTSLELGRQLDDNFDRRPSNPFNLRAERGLDDNFEEAQLEVNFIADLPFGEGKALGGLPVLDQVLGGFRLSGIVRISTGERFTIELPGDWNNDGLSNDRPDRLGPGNLSSSERSIDRWFDTSAFAFPDPLGYGNAGRNILLGPGYHNWDLSLLKDFDLPNGHQLELRFAFFNALNHPSFENPSRILGTRSFGVIDEARRAREIEIALKYSF